MIDRDANLTLECQQRFGVASASKNTLIINVDFSPEADNQSRIIFYGVLNHGFVAPNVGGRRCVRLSDWLSAARPWPTVLVNLICALAF